MPNWKKVIVSGSNASLNSLIVDNGITGSLFGTASFAVTSSYSISASQAISSSFITASNVFGPYGSNSVISASFAQTASSAQNASDILIYVKNSSGAQINKGKVVRITGAVGDNPLIGTASYFNDNLSANTLGITNQNIANDAFGYVITEGTLLGINTNAFTAGQLVYLGDTGSIIGTAPVAPLHAVRLGQVLRSQLNNGSIYVRIDNGFELGELHDVKDTTTTGSYGDLLVKSGSIWINSKQLTGSYGLTGSLTVINGGITSSLQGTSSFAIQAITSSYVDSFTVKNNAIISGSLTILQNLTVFGSASITYVSESTLNIGTNLITVNSNTPAVRFGGIAVIDSGSSPQVSGSWLFDSTQNRWIFLHQQTAGSALTSSIGIMGPETYNNQGNETQITLNRLTKGYSGASGEHIGDSQISDNGTTVSIPGNLTITGSIIGNITISGSTTITGSLGVGTTGSAVVGRIDASNDVVAFATSDINLKENLKPIANALYKLDNIQGYTFDWKQDEKLVSQHGFTGRDIGVIAQEIEEILPEVVTTRDSGYKAVKYEKIVPFLIQCIKELKDEIEELKGAKTPKKTRKPRAKNKPE